MIAFLIVKINSLIKIITVDQIMYFTDACKCMNVWCVQELQGAVLQQMNPSIPLKFSWAVTHWVLYISAHTHRNTSALAISNTCTKTHPDPVLCYGKKGGWGLKGRRETDWKKEWRNRIRHVYWGILWCCIDFMFVFFLTLSAETC